MHDDRGFSEEKCVRCGWVMGHQPLNCQNDDTPHVFPSQRRDLWDDPSAKAWVSHVVDDMVPKLSGSSVVVSLAPSDAGEGDVKYWVELGASIMMDKPIIVVVFHDQDVPEKLRLVADEVVRCERGVDVASSDALAAAIKRVLPPGQEGDDG